jgi:predicted  nucleic acid-binding Zn-ribbon protein
MSNLDTLKELQSAHDNLKTIERDLTAFPPEMAGLGKTIKDIDKRLGELQNKTIQGRTLLEATEKQYQQAIKAEAHARKELKSSAHKAQYTMAMRELDDKERKLEAAQRALKEAETGLKAIEEEVEKLRASQEADKKQFEELHEIFLSEHENQVTARGLLTKKIAELESSLDTATLNNFKRLLVGKAGKAVVAMEKGACAGCNTKLRTTLVYELRAKGSVNCEFCKRILYLPQEDTRAT